MSRGRTGTPQILLSLLILGAVGYNTWQINSLRAEVERLKQRAAAAAAATASERAYAPATDRDAPMEIARRHTEQARQFLRKERYAEAREELRAAREAIAAAARDGRTGGEEAVTEARRTVTRLSEQLETLWPRRRSAESEDN